MKITELIKQGTVKYTHYNQTMTSIDSADHDLECPRHLLTLAAKYPDAEVVIYGDDTLGIDINGVTWAVQNYDADMRPGKRLPAEVWQYLNIAMSD